MGPLILTSADVLALLLTDTLIFLQDKDQKYTFAAVVCAHQRCWRTLKDTNITLFCLIFFVTKKICAYPAGPKASRHRLAEADCARSSERREGNVPDQRVRRWARNVRGPHIVQRGAKHLDEVHQRGRGEVRMKLCFFFFYITSLLLENVTINHCHLLLSCPEEEEEYTSESEEEKRAAEARVQKIHKLQGI